MLTTMVSGSNFTIDMTGYANPANPSKYAFTTDLPDMLHDLAGNFSFADGHVETHRWLDPRTVPPLVSGAVDPLSYTATPAPGSVDVA